MLAANEALIECFHGHARTLMISRTRKNGPAFVRLSGIGFLLREIGRGIPRRRP